MKGLYLKNKNKKNYFHFKILLCFKHFPSFIVIGCFISNYHDFCRFSFVSSKKFEGKPNIASLCQLFEGKPNIERLCQLFEGKPNIERLCQLFEGKPNMITYASYLKGSQTLKAYASY